MKCKNYKELINLYLTDSLNEKTKQKLEKHLFVCDSCYKEFELLRKCINELNSLEQVHTKDDFIRRLNNKINFQSESLKPALFSYIKIPLSAAAMLMLLMGGYLTVRKHYLKNPNLLKGPTTIQTSVYTKFINNLKSAINKPSLKKLKKIIPQDIAGILKESKCEIVKVNKINEKNLSLLIEIPLNAYSSFFQKIQNKKNVNALVKNKTKNFVTVELIINK
ncbi:anti-sigma factor family protein [bacterium]